MKKCESKITAPLMNVRQCAAHFGVSHRVVRKWVHDGSLKAFRLAGVLRFSESSIAEFVTENERVRDRQLDRSLPCQ